MADWRPPLRRDLEVELSEAAVQRMWGRIRERRASAPVERRLWQLRWAASALVMATALALLVIRPSVAPPRAVALVTRDGRPLTKLIGDGEGATELSDGSRLILARGAELEVVENTSGRFVSVLRRGRGRFEVKPGGPRRWTIEAGLVSVEVVGTRFAVTRTGEATEVEVTHGTVVVRGEHVPDRVQRLDAGERLRIVAPLGADGRRQAEGQRDAAGAEEPEPNSTATPSASPVAKSAPAGMAEGSGGPSARGPAAVAAGRQGSAAPASSFDELMAQADARRRSGDTEGAVQALRAAVGAGSPDGRAAIAAFSLGKLLLDQAGQPSAAAEAFALCLTLRPPRALAEDALARLVEAEARSGRRERARVRAAEYRQTYPNGRRLPSVEQWVSDP